MVHPKIPAINKVKDALGVGLSEADRLIHNETPFVTMAGLTMEEQYMAAADRAIGRMKSDNPKKVKDNLRRRRMVSRIKDDNSHRPRRK